MAAFSITNLINDKARAAAGTTTGTEYKEIYLSPYEVKEAPKNTRQECKDIDKLADSFLLVGQEQPTVLARVNGEYRIIDGHRRNLANIYNLERGYQEFAKVRYFFRDMSEIMYELALLAGNGYTQELTDYEKTELAARLKAALEAARDAGEIVIEGRVRDLVGEILGEKPTNMARIEKINNNAEPEIKEQFKEGNIGISAAYEAAKLPAEEQQAIAARAAAGENVKTKEIAQKVAEMKAGDEYRTPHPISITSLCYSCKNYSTCNVKTGTCEKCDQYINKAEAEKTDAQRYDEEQAAIDKETEKRLREKSDQEKLEKALGSTPERKRHEIKIAAMYYDDVVSGRKRFELRKNDRGYKVGDALKMLEFTDGKFTGRTIDADIIYMLEDYTGLQENYCILGIAIVSEKDTKEEQLPGQTSIYDLEGVVPNEQTAEEESV